MTHDWRYFQAGGTDQVLIETADDLRNLRQLDQKRWVALACPTRGLEFDDRTLDLIDTDHDGRIRAPELIDACEWVAARLGDLRPLLRGEARVALSSLSGSPEGEALREAARRTLLQSRDGAELPAAQEADEAITLEVVQARQKHLASERFNGDGILAIEDLEDAADRALAQRIHDLTGGALDASGRAGLSEDNLKRFFTDVEALLAWHREGEADCGPLRPAAMAVQAVHDKVEDYFARCRLAAYQGDITAVLNAPDPERLKTAAGDLLTLDSDALRRLPAAPVRAEGALPLDERANPAWRDGLARLREHALPLLGDAVDQGGPSGEGAELREADWQALKQRVRVCREWLQRRPDSAVAALGVDAVQSLVRAAAHAPTVTAHADGTATADADAAIGVTRARLLGLVEQDRAAAPQHAALNDLEKLLRLQRDLLRLLRNFVSFEAFYEGEGAVFQAGTLYLDGRACELTVPVADPAKHAVIAGLAKAYLVYCECTNPKEKPRHIVAVVSAGDVDFLFVGRNGLFYDRRGRDWDARIVKVIENPISVGQAFLSPYKKLVRMVEERVAKRAAASDAAQQGKLGDFAGRVATVDKAVAAPAPAAAAGATGTAAAGPLPATGRVDVGTVAAMGVALGSISTVIVGVFGRFVDLGWWIPVALVCILLSISGPSMLIAWLKLRQRSLGPILDASGWAINNRMRLSVRQGDALTQRPRPVPHARRLRLAGSAKPEGDATSSRG